TTELAQSLKAAADREMICRDVAETSEIWERTVTPENILALVEALETEKRICATWRKTTESTSEKLEKAQAAERRWHRVASRVHEQACESDVKIDELEAIRAAAEKLVRCKGRYHSEQNYRALAALFGVNIPDLPPLEHDNVHYADAAEMEIAALRQRIAELECQLKSAENNEIDARCHIAELESRTVTVKLPQRHSMLLREDFNEDYHTKMAYKADEVNASLAAAGIKVEAE
ncbi:TPA: ead/Ea22-like family protein, partial [Klebsiella pneumoniae]|nr:ead/Ea22-like family protein [Klebsiella pneumoniae]HBR5330915.1 ead/Ea22-like family protein [Klebsiella pneumoniae]HBS6822180.1 ead/Ea22-like family protein [Klebsiella pneumoniae]HDY6897123.1 ead/Ea22-like family protein [Klebsiella pneumoniae]HDY8825077.1 ead/Ea22-like family protein [Klebsiella pneumoniae]